MNRRRLLSHHLLAACLGGAALLLSACATFGGRSTGDDRDAATPAELEAALGELRAAEDLYTAGRYREAATRADSLFTVWDRGRRLVAMADRALSLKARALEADGDLGDAGRSWAALVERIGEGPMLTEAVLRLAGIREATGDAVGALEILLEHPQAVGAAQLETMRDAVPQLRRAELVRLAQRYRPRDAVSAVVHAELARVLVLEDRVDSAHRVARRILTARPADEERRTAEVILAAEEGGLAGPLRVGAVLPLSGRLAGVGELLREGLELALEHHAEAGGPSVEIAFRDDGSDPERAVELVGELEREGVLAVIGPIRSESLAGAARARRSERLLLLSPTATEVRESSRNAYTLWDRRRLQTDAARDVARWAVQVLGMRRAAVLYPADETGEAAATAFREGLTSAGGTLVGATSYDPTQTTFREPVAATAAARPDFVYVAGFSVPTVLMLGPQLQYYGIDRSVIAGDPTWSDPAVVRRLDAAAADFRLIGLFVDRSSPGTPWEEFRNAYESRYRKRLDNMLPALAYDAGRLALRALREVRLPLPGAVSAYVRDGGEVAGVTGRMTPDPASSTVQRRTLVRLLRDAQLVDADRGRILEWLARARARADSIAAADTTASPRRPRR